MKVSRSEGDGLVVVRRVIGLSDVVIDIVRMERVCLGLTI